MRWLETMRPRFIAAGEEFLASVQKLFGKKVDPVPPVDAVDMEIAQLEADLYEALVRAVRAGTQDAAMSVGSAIRQPSSSALRAARDRAAQLVGRRRDAEGRLMENPNAKFAITESVRQEVRDKVQEAVREGWANDRLAAELGALFDESRADMIARTETAIAYNTGVAETFIDIGQDLVLILDGEGCTPDGHDDGAPAPDENLLGEVQLEALADGQVWTPQQLLEHPTAHPNCVRAAVAYEPELSSKEAA